jgi:hypothetical protein
VSREAKASLRSWLRPAEPVPRLPPTLLGAAPASARPARAPKVVAFASGSLQGDYLVRIEVTTSGDLGVAVFRYSLDGGAKWTASVQLVPASGQ